ncbi:hypothetical protein PROFUN_00202 [Planoprotostelium fungivorum]|uniref:Poly [ADP-ribose] polymerase n=1 Tax=Planoprotostelium fungivorum TaxID=1890364 RepID=A0A2P6P0Z2_9EUKA|nr:hypothetical protein PROFUN_00202 [Planoprotostelium fungivorum]
MRFCDYFSTKKTSHHSGLMDGKDSNWEDYEAEEWPDLSASAQKPSKPRDHYSTANALRAAHPFFESQPTFRILARNNVPDNSRTAVAPSQPVMLQKKPPSDFVDPFNDVKPIASRSVMQSPPIKMTLDIPERKSVPKGPEKSLEERKEEYAEARRRILGEAGSNSEPTPLSLVQHNNRIEDKRVEGHHKGEEEEEEEREKAEGIIITHTAPFTNKQTIDFRRTNKLFRTRGSVPACGGWFIHSHMDIKEADMDTKEVEMEEVVVEVPPLIRDGLLTNTERAAIQWSLLLRSYIPWVSLLILFVSSLVTGVVLVVLSKRSLFLGFLSAVPLFSMLCIFPGLIFLFRRAIGRRRAINIMFTEEVHFLSWNYSPLERSATSSLQWDHHRHRCLKVFILILLTTLALLLLLVIPFGIESKNILCGALLGFFDLVFVCHFSFRFIPHIWDRFRPYDPVIHSCVLSKEIFYCEGKMFQLQPLEKNPTSNLNHLVTADMVQENVRGIVYEMLQISIRKDHLVRVFRAGLALSPSSLETLFTEDQQSAAVTVFNKRSTTGLRGSGAFTSSQGTTSDVMDEDDGFAGSDEEMFSDEDELDEYQQDFDNSVAETLSENAKDDINNHLTRLLDMRPDYAVAMIRRANIWIARMAFYVDIDPVMARPWGVDLSRSFVVELHLSPPKYMKDTKAPRVDVYQTDDENIYREYLIDQRFNGLAWYLKDRLSKYIVSNWPPKNTTFLPSLLDHAIHRIFTCAHNCIICDDPLPTVMVRPSVCNSTLCLHSHESYGLGVDIANEIRDNADIVKLLIDFTAAASTASNNKRFNPFPTRVEAEVKGETGQMTKINFLNQLNAPQPSLVMPTMESLSACKDTKQIKERLDRIEGMKCENQYLFVSSPPEKESKFQQLKKKHGAFWAFHGSSLFNWHSILRIGLKNFSNTEFMSAGAAYGAGIYMAEQFSTSLTYALHHNIGSKVCLAICEVIKAGYKANPYYVVPNEDHVITRYFLVYENREAAAADSACLASKLQNLKSFVNPDTHSNTKKKK